MTDAAGLSAADLADDVGRVFNSSQPVPHGMTEVVHRAGALEVSQEAPGVGRGLGVEDADDTGAPPVRG